VKVEVFDITEVLYSTPANGKWEPVHPAWVAPLAVFDALPNNIRALAVDKLSDDLVMVYVGVSRMGIMSIPFKAATGFLDSERHLTKTPGEVWGLSIRENADPARRTLMCADGHCGHRVYSLNLVQEQAMSGTGQ